MEPKTAASAHLDEALHEKVQHYSPDASGILTIAHLYREDSEGRVLERLLLPRPTNDSRDPLTWAPWRKHLALTSVCCFVFLSNYITLSISPILVNVVEEFEIDLTQASYLISFKILVLGLGNLFWIPLSEKIGKRAVLVAASGIFFISSIWSAVAKTYASEFAARVFQGFGASCSEGLGPAVIADLYFIHERGLWMGFHIIMFTVGTSCSGIFAGLIANATTEWRWVWWMNVILTGFLFLLVLLFSAETNFARPLENESGEGMQPSELATIRAVANTRWITSLSFISWYKDLSIWWLWWRPFLTLQYSAVIYATLTYGVVLAWLLVQSTADGAVFPAVYGFSSLAVRNISISYLVASFLGSAAGGPLSDWIIKFITKRRGGYFVPGFRFWCLLPSFLIAQAGLLMWDCSIEYELPYMVSIVGTAITYSVLCAIPAVVMTYVVDCYRPLAAETMTIDTVSKNTFAFALSFAVFPWLERDGYAKVSGYNLLIEGVIFFLSIPMYIYGARLRQWTSKQEV